jgi:hypothetical protein
LFDKNVPVGVRGFLAGRSSHRRRNELPPQLENGDLLNAAEMAAFDVMVPRTVDYSSASKTMASRLRGLSEDRKSTYQRFTLPVVPLFLVQGLTRDREVAERQQQTRKAETAAVVAAVRAEANFSDT